jgi:hypothetical protein
MMATRGAVFVAYGDNARREVRLAVASLATHMPGLPAVVFSDNPLPGLTVHLYDDTDPGARLVKLNLDLLAPFDEVLYLDADTRVQQDLSTGFKILEGSWDLAIAPSRAQDSEFLWLCSEAERQDTVEMYSAMPVVLQGGTMFWRSCDRVHALFAAWREEFLLWPGQDQGALLRALARAPARVWLLGRAWAGGGIVAHHFGQARR